MSAIDVLNKVAKISASGLGPTQRVLLVTDGTLTEILEASFLERIQLIKVTQQVVKAKKEHFHLEPRDEETVMERQIILRGSESGRNYVYAESLIAVDRLGAALSEELLNSQVPLGRLWLEHKLETFKEMVEIDYRKSAELSKYFDGDNVSLLLVRRYRVWSGKKVVMVVTEFIPAFYDFRPPTMRR
jgi:chorismate-pyruvate lyase